MVHPTDPCDDDWLRVITNRETTPAATADGTIAATIHAHLADWGLLSAEHVLDAGDVAAETLVTCQQRPAVDGVGLVLSDNSGQARQPDGRDRRGCARDWDAQRITCPAGKTSVRWTPDTSDQGAGQAVIAIQFHPDDGRPCPLHAGENWTADDASPPARPARSAANRPAAPSR